MVTKNLHYFLFHYISNSYNISNSTIMNLVYTAFAFVWSLMNIPGQCIKTIQDVAIYVIISHYSCDHPDRPQDITSLLHKCISYFNP